jgi:Protein of unknown function (DUF3892)/Common central domain of tyrosinase
MCVEVKYANLAPDGDIAAVGGDNLGGGRWGLSVQEAIDRIDSGQWTFYVEQPANDRVLIVVAQREGRRYLKTTPDRDKPNNLLALPRPAQVITGQPPGFPAMLPGASTPVLRQVLRAGQPPQPVTAALRMDGAFPLLPAASVWVRFAAPWPADLEVKLDGFALERAASGTTTRPDLDALDLGWYHVSSLTNIDRDATGWEIVVVAPPSKRRGPRYTIAIAHATINPNCRRRGSDTDKQLLSRLSEEEKSVPLILKIERGRPRGTLNQLNPVDRTTLFDAISRFLTDTVVADHAGITHSGAHLILGHRTYIERAERFLRDNGLGRFTPLPKWDPAEEIPPEFRAVRPYDNGSMGDRTPLQNFNPQKPLPPEFLRPDICNVATLDQLGNNLNRWHAEVHNAIGGTMDEFRIASAAPIFWCWHAFVDDVAFDWETCP